MDLAHSPTRDVEQQRAQEQQREQTKEQQITQQLPELSKQIGKQIASNPALRTQMDGYSPEQQKSITQTLGTGILQNSGSSMPRIDRLELTKEGGIYARFNEFKSLTIQPDKVLATKEQTDSNNLTKISDDTLANKSHALQQSEQSSRDLQKGLADNPKISQNLTDLSKQIDKQITNSPALLARLEKYTPEQKETITQNLGSAILQNSGSNMPRIDRLDVTKEGDIYARFNEFKSLTIKPDEVITSIPQTELKQALDTPQEKQGLEQTQDLSLEQAGPRQYTAKKGDAALHVAKALDPDNPNAALGHLLKSGQIQYIKGDNNHIIPNIRPNKEYTYDPSQYSEADKQLLDKTARGVIGKESTFNAAYDQEVARQAERARQIEQAKQAEIAQAKQAELHKPQPNVMDVLFQNKANHYSQSLYQYQPLSLMSQILPKNTESFTMINQAATHNTAPIAQRTPEPEKGWFDKIKDGAQDLGNKVAEGYQYVDNKVSYATNKVSTGYRAMENTVADALKVDANDHSFLAGTKRMAASQIANVRGGALFVSETVSGTVDFAVGTVKTVGTGYVATADFVSGGALSRNFQFARDAQVHNQKVSDGIVNITKTVGQPIVDAQLNQLDNLSFGLLSKNVTTFQDARTRQNELADKAVNWAGSYIKEADNAYATGDFRAQSHTVKDVLNVATIVLPMTKGATIAKLGEGANVLSKATTAAETVNAVNKTATVAETANTLNKAATAAETANAVNKTATVAETANTLNKAATTAETANVMNKTAAATETISTMNKVADVGETANAINKTATAAETVNAANKTAQASERASVLNRTAEEANALNKTVENARNLENATAQAAKQTAESPFDLKMGGRSELKTPMPEMTKPAPFIEELKRNIDMEAFNRVYEKAPLAKQEIDSLASTIAAKYDGAVATAPIKSVERSLEKIALDYNGNPERIKDLARNTIVVDERHLSQVVAELEQSGAKVKTISAADNPLGYSGINTTLETKAGMVAEIQVNTPAIIYAKESEAIAKSMLGEDAYNAIARKVGTEGGQGHKFYEEWRVATDPKQRAMIEAKSTEYYNNIREAAKAPEIVQASNSAKIVEGTGAQFAKEAESGLELKMGGSELKTPTSEIADAGSMSRHTAQLLEKSAASKEDLYLYLKNTDDYLASKGIESDLAKVYAETGKWPENIQIPKDSSVLKSNGEIDWGQVPHDGFKLDVNGKPILDGHKLEIGETIDRYGSPNGRFTSPLESEKPFNYSQRSLPYVEDIKSYHQYEVIGDISEIKQIVTKLDNTELKLDVEAYINKQFAGNYEKAITQSGHVAGGFGSVGGAIQYKLPIPVEWLEQLGILKEIK